MAMSLSSAISRRLAQEQGVGSIVNLQEDTDMAFFDLDLSPIRERCMARGDVAHNRHPIRDFDPFDLRMRLEGAVQLVADQAKALKGSGKKVYIHCTAGECLQKCSPPAGYASSSGCASMDVCSVCGDPRECCHCT